VQNIDWRTDGTQLLTASWDGSIRVWDPETGKEQYRFCGHSSQIQFAAFSPDGAAIVSVANDNTIRVWNNQKTNTAEYFSNEWEFYTEVHFTPDNQKLLIPDEGNQTISLYEIESARVLWKSAGGHCAAISSDGRTVASGNHHGQLTIHDAQDGTPQRTIETGSTGLHSLAFSPDHRFLASNENTWNHRDRPSAMKVWDPATGHLIHWFDDQIGWVSMVAFSPDGRWLAA
jgi:WD40 repeat protein